MSQSPFTVQLITADRIRVPDRAGELVINRYVWPVTAQSNGDAILIGYLPADTKLDAANSQVIGDGATGAMTFDVCVADDTNKVVAAQAVVAATFVRAAFSTYQLAETLATDSNNRAVYLLLSTAPTVAGGKIIVDLASFATGN